MAMMRMDEIADVCAALANQTGAGIPLADAVMLLVQLQPRQGEMWASVSREISRGGTLSKAVEPIWPEDIVAAIAAGEESGELSRVCAQIENAIEVRRSAFGVLAQLFYPLGILVAGCVASMFFLFFVIPTLMQSLVNGSHHRPSAILAFGIYVNSLIVGNVTGASVVLSAIGLSLFLWVVSGRAVQHAQAAMLSMPGIAPQAAAIFYALWARTLGIMTGAGIPIMRALPLSVMSLPVSLRDSVRAIHAGLDQSQPLGRAVQPDNAFDERSKLHFYIVNAFKVAEQTGVLDVELDRAAPIMIRDATRRIKKVSGLCMLVAMVLAGTMLVLPMGAYYSELFSMIGKM